MNPDPDLDDLIDFVKGRIDQKNNPPHVIDAVQAILTMACEYRYECVPDYAGGYADASEDALRAISGMWRYHPDYKGWADDNY